MTGGSGGPADAPALPDPEPPAGVLIRTAAPADELDVRRVLDGAMLEVADEALAAALENGTALVALAERGGDRDPAVAGALVVTAAEGVTDAGTATGAAHLDAVAVRLSRRGRGIGTALVARALADAAASGHERLIAEFDASLREFYADLGFSVTPETDRGAESEDGTVADANRLRGVRRLPAHGDERRDSGSG
ncbi:GNAT family N-acetyltransferase [Haloparvum sedimenti]|uniref:GNAT family N-acetyltransferase n=1 Tax=Haloparvum sedimenti TaxID=1678448 RepID=UPI00071E8C90|nr:GNAT family N-acetyltransferase [Haloparvum sedimenti]